MKTAATNKKIREIITLVKEGKLIPRPEFQRRLVWTREDKNFFLDSVLRRYPFPEIYLADGDVDVETGIGTQLLVDGLQRVNTLVQYFNGDSDLKLTSVPPYRELTEDAKKEFLQYDVSVRDLGAISRETIIEIFRRINATKYSVSDIEVNNAVYAGAFKKFCSNVAESDFFKDNEVFSASDYKRMGDLRFVLVFVASMIVGYFNRDDALEDLLATYNDDFPREGEIQERLTAVFDLVKECNFERKSRIWRKADLLTALVELDIALHSFQLILQPSDVVEKLGEFFDQVETGALDQNEIAGIYYKAALQASNDRVNRVRRGLIIQGILQEKSSEAIQGELRASKLLPG
jgi:hypothetical protein